MNPMHRMLPAVAVFLAASLPAALAGGPATDRSPGRAAPQAVVDAMEQQVVPDLDAEGITLRDFLALLRDRVPGFQAVVSAEAIGDLGLPPIHIKKVTVGQILTLVANLYPDVQVNPLNSGGSAPVYLFTPQRAPVLPGTRVVAYGLSKLVDRLAARNAPAKNAAAPDQAARAKALDEVLTLVKTTLAQSDADERAVLQVHEGTQTILVKGTQSQTESVRNTLNSLEESLGPDPLIDKLHNEITRAGQDYELNHARLEAEIQRLKDEIQAANCRIESLNQEVLQREEEATRLKVRLEALEAKGKPQQ